MERPLLEGAFTGKIWVLGDGSVRAALLETDFGAEFTEIYQAKREGAYIGEVREAYRAFLAGIRERCFRDLPAGRVWGEKAVWLIPADPKVYDVARGFRESPDHSLVWHQKIRVLPGDDVYIYYAAPVASISFRCRVEGERILREDGVLGMKLVLQEEYPPGRYSRAFLNAHGIAKTVRGQRRCPEELAELLAEDR